MSMVGDLLSKLVKTKCIVKWSNTSYHSLCTSGALNVPTAILNSCFNCDATDHGVVSCPHKKDQNKTAENNNKFIRMKKSQGGNGGGKTWAKHSNKKGWNNKPQNQQQSNKKANGNGYTKRNNEVHLVDGKFMCLWNKGCGFNTSHTTVFHDTWANCLQNNQPSNFPATHFFQNKMLGESGKVPHVASNNRGGT